MSVWQPYFNIQKDGTDSFHKTANKTDAYHQYKLRQSMEAEAAFFGQIKYLHRVKVHIEPVPSNSILCIPM